MKTLSLIVLIAFLFSCTSEEDPISETSIHQLSKTSGIESDTLILKGKDFLDLPEFTILFTENNSQTEPGVKMEGRLISVSNTMIRFLPPEALPLQGDFKIGLYAKEEANNLLGQELSFQVLSPVIFGYFPNAGNHNGQLEISGRYLNRKNLSVLFHDINPAEIEFISENLIICRIPEDSIYQVVNIKLMDSYTGRWSKIQPDHILPFTYSNYYKAGGQDELLSIKTGMLEIRTGNFYPGHQVQAFIDGENLEPLTCEFSGSEFLYCFKLPEGLKEKREVSVSVKYKSIPLFNAYTHDATTYMTVAP
jgi:hypothetical protein